MMTAPSPSPVLRRYAPLKEEQRGHQRALSQRIQASIAAIEHSGRVIKSQQPSPATIPITKGHVKAIRDRFAAITQTSTRSTLPLPNTKQQLNQHNQHDQHNQHHTSSNRTASLPLSFNSSSYGLQLSNDHRDRTDDLESPLSLISSIAKRRGQFRPPSTIDIDTTTQQTSNSSNQVNQIINQSDRSFHSHHHHIVSGTPFTSSISRSQPTSPQLIGHKRRHKSVRFQRSFVIREYCRVVGGSGGIPRTGGIALGLDWDVVKQSKQRIPSSKPDTHLNAPNLSSPRRRYPTPAASKDDELPRLGERDRRDLMSIDASQEVEELGELEQIRISRQTNFCQCVPIVRQVMCDGEIKQELICCSDASICSCARTGVQCHIEGSNYCKCSVSHRISCENPEGVYRFDDNAVRLHAHRLLFSNHHINEGDSPNMSPSSVPFSPSISCTSSPLISPRSSASLRSQSFSSNSVNFTLLPNVTRRASRVSPPPSPLLDLIRAMNNGA